MILKLSLFYWHWNSKSLSISTDISAYDNNRCQLNHLHDSNLSDLYSAELILQGTDCSRKGQYKTGHHTKQHPPGIGYGCVNAGLK